MLKHSNYIIISLFVIFLFFLFQAFNPSVYQVAGKTELTVITKKADEAVGGHDTATIEYAVITGQGPPSEYVKNAQRTLEFLSRPYQSYESVASFYQGGSARSSVRCLVIAAEEIGADETALLRSFLANGGQVVFALMPNCFGDNQTELRQLLGITALERDYTIEGFDIYELLLGGTFRSLELTFDCAKIRLAGKCKVFANGHNPLRDKTAKVIEIEDENPLIWRTYHEGGEIYVINAPFLEDFSGVGVLTGVLSKLEDDFIYPVVYAKAILVDNFPYIASEDVQINSRTVFAFSRDIIWPNLLTMATESNLAFSCVTNGQFASNPNSASILAYFNDELNRWIDGELRYSLHNEKRQPFYNEDIAFLKEHFPSLCTPDNCVILDSVGTDAFSWISDSVVGLPVISRGTDSEREDFRFVSAASAMGLIVHAIDLAPAIENSRENEWNPFSMEIAKYLSSRFSGYAWLPSAPISQTAERIKDYRNTDMAVSREADTMTVTLENQSGEMAFILRTDKKIARGINCDWKSLEDGAYLITSQSASFELILEQKAK